MAVVFAIGHLSGGHYNPAVTLGLTIAKRFDAAAVVPYIVSQCLGGIAAALVFYLIATGKIAGFEIGNFASNTYGGPDGYSMYAVFALEAILTALLVFVIMGVTSERAPPDFAPLAIGVTLAAIHIMAIPVSNASVNPARSLATALVALGEPISQVWLFWVAPLLGGLAGGLLGRWFYEE
jgi:aquaporin Z